MQDLLVTKIRKNAREVIHLTLGDYQGHQVFNARVFYENDDGEMRPGKSGLAFKVDKLADFADGVSLALETARARGLVK